MNIASNSPDALMVFFPYDKEDSAQAKTNPLKLKPAVIAHRDIMQLNTRKPKTGVGTFQATLSSNQNYGQKIQPGCWVMIFMSNNKISESAVGRSDSGLKMVGIVRSVRAVESLSDNGVRQVRYTITGEDFHHFLNTEIYINATLKSKNGDAKAQDAFILLGERLKLVQGPGPIVDTILDSFLGEPVVDGQEFHSAAKGGMPISVPAEVSTRIIGAPVKDNRFNNLLKRYIQDDLIGQNLPMPDVGSMFSVWSIVQSYAHRILNECYTDLLPYKHKGEERLRPSFIMRAIPFSSPKGKPHKSCKAVTDTDKSIGLYVSREIVEADIMSFNYGRSDMERFNFFFVVNGKHPDSATGAAGMLSKVAGDVGGINNMGDTGSMARYGFKPYISASNYLLHTDNDIPGVVNKIVKDMWEKAHLFDNGVATIRGNHEHIPVGSNVKFSDRGWIAHVEAVEHNFQGSETGANMFRTTIAFTRLQLPNGQPVSSKETPGQRGDWDRGVSHVYNRDAK